MTKLFVPSTTEQGRRHNQFRPRNIPAASAAEPVASGQLWPPSRQRQFSGWRPVESVMMPTPQPETASIPPSITHTPRFHHNPPYYSDRNVSFPDSRHDSSAIYTGTGSISSRIPPTRADNRHRHTHPIHIDNDTHADTHALVHHTDTHNHASNPTTRSSSPNPSLGLDWNFRPVMPGMGTRFIAGPTTIFIVPQSPPLRSFSPRLSPSLPPSSPASSSVLRPCYYSRPASPDVCSPTLAVHPVSPDVRSPTFSPRPVSPDVCLPSRPISPNVCPPSFFPPSTSPSLRPLSYSPRPVSPYVHPTFPCSDLVTGLPASTHASSPPSTSPPSSPSFHHSPPVIMTRSWYSPPTGRFSTSQHQVRITTPPPHAPPSPVVMEDAADLNPSRIDPSEQGGVPTRVGNSGGNREVSGRAPMYSPYASPPTPSSFSESSSTSLSFGNCPPSGSPLPPCLFATGWTAQTEGPIHVPSPARIPSCTVNASSSPQGPRSSPCLPDGYIEVSKESNYICLPPPPAVDIASPRTSPGPIPRDGERRRIENRKLQHVSQNEGSRMARSSRNPDRLTPHLDLPSVPVPATVSRSIANDFLEMPGLSGSPDSFIPPSKPPSAKDVPPSAVDSLSVPAPAIATLPIMGSVVDECNANKTTSPHPSQNQDNQTRGDSLNDSNQPMQRAPMKTVASDDAIDRRWSSPIYYGLQPKPDPAAAASAPASTNAMAGSSTGSTSGTGMSSRESWLPPIRHALLDTPVPPFVGHDDAGVNSNGRKQFGPERPATLNGNENANPGRPRSYGTGGQVLGMNSVGPYGYLNSSMNTTTPAAADTGPCWYTNPYYSNPSYPYQNPNFYPWNPYPSQTRVPAPGPLPVPLPASPLPLPVYSQTGSWQGFSNTSSPRWKRHERFYFHDGNIVVRIKDVLYKLHRHLLDQHSSILASRFRGATYWGNDDASPVWLSEESTEAFDVLLGILYHSDFTTPASSTVRTAYEWTLLLSFAHAYAISGVASLAVSNLSFLASPVDKLTLARKYGREYPEMRAWVIPAWMALCMREETLTKEEGEKLGVEGLLGLDQVKREMKGVLETALRDGRLFGAAM